MLLEHAKPIDGSSAARREAMDASRAFRQLSASELDSLAFSLAGAAVPGVTLSESEFAQWCPADVRAEWVDGKVVLMSPSNVDHDDLSTWLTTLLRLFVEERDAGRIFHDLFVRLSAMRRRRVPDLMFIAADRLHLLKQTYLNGPPDLVMEIVSPDSQSRDRREKFIEYQKAGVPEYWIIDPISKTIEVHRLHKKKFVSVEEVDGIIASTVLRGLRFKAAQFWSKPLPKVAAVLRAMKRA